MLPIAAKHIDLRNADLPDIHFWGFADAAFSRWRGIELLLPQNRSSIRSFASADFPTTKNVLSPRRDPANQTRTERTFNFQPLLAQHPFAPAA
ncbi:hypothetical protein [Roseobacter cerasinus]|uniref:hypothetical protein n=1 Tax=Roseobacter cerasinus TaxID=2602289 RepID=UPI00135B1CD7|nr:hypothetical protein [Roseobacter cerasinus]